MSTFLLGNLWLPVLPLIPHTIHHLQAMLWLSRRMHRFMPELHYVHVSETGRQSLESEVTSRAMEWLPNALTSTAVPAGKLWFKQPKNCLKSWEGHDLPISYRWSNPAQHRICQVFSNTEVPNSSTMSLCSSLPNNIKIYLPQRW